MLRKTSFIALMLLCLPLWAQVPPGDPYDPAKHPNAIITYVLSRDFKASAYAEAAKEAGIELLGLAQPEAIRQSIEMAAGGIRKTNILGRSVEVVYYPVVRQTFKLSGGEDITLSAFKFPRISSIPPGAIPAVLDQAAREKKKNPQEMRFGGTEMPEQFRIRGSDALLFDKDGVVTAYWTEDGVGYTATGKMDRRRLFGIIEDLL